MRAQLECFCCNIRQAQEAVGIAGKDRESQWLVSQKVCQLYAKADPAWTPAFMTTRAHDLAKAVAGVEDIFYQLKRHYNQLALKLYPRLKQFVTEGPASQHLERAIRVAIAGNLIDLGVYQEIKAEQLLNEVEHTSWGKYQFDLLQKEINAARKIVYVGDNAGEVVFDRILLEEMDSQKEIVFVIKGGPISNDALLQDAQEAGIEKIARLMTTGQAEIGLRLEAAPPELQEFWAQADLIISKGQGNFETLSEAKGNLFFLLKAKCLPVARELGVSQGALVLQRRD